jgi:16S rRNA (cytosine967-C5)-methyltransferase
VTLVRNAGRASATGLVNAVLRRVDPERARHAWPPRPQSELLGQHEPPRETAVDYLTISLSHPRWLVERWLDRFGFDVTERWARFNNARAPLTLRPVRWKLERDDLAARLAAHGVITRAASFAPDALIVVEGHPFQTPLAAEGLFLAQDEASQLVAQLAADLDPSLVLDACASPGGKTTYIRGVLGKGSRAVACDFRPRRVKLLRATLDHVGAPHVHLVRADAGRALPFASVFDVVLLDVPCSGLGTIRREPEVRWRREPSHLPMFVETQRRMLQEAAGCVKPQGYLVYSTCSSEPEENEENVRFFLECHPEFVRVLPGEHPWRSTPLESLLDAEGDLRTLPHEHGLEAFYGAVIRKQV